MSFIRLVLRLLLILPVLCLLVACEIPGGASVPDSKDDGLYEVNLPYTEVGFTVSTTPVTGTGVSATAVPRDMRPELYYRYDVQSKVNGSYAGMPYPPMLYTIRKIPFYKDAIDHVPVRIDLQSTGTDVVRTSQATCSFDINGKTVASTPLNAADLLPGHSLSVEVPGPTPDQFGDASGVMTVWVYGLGNDKNQTLRWDIPYTVTQETRQVKGQFVGQTSKPEEAKPYEGREEPAQPVQINQPPPTRD